MKAKTQTLCVTKVNNERMVVKTEVKSPADAFQMLLYLVRATTKIFNQEPIEVAEMIKGAIELANGKETVLFSKKEGE